MEPRDVRAAGAVVTRKGGEVLLVHRPRYDDWSFPKGKLDRGEHVVDRRRARGGRGDRAGHPAGAGAVAAALPDVRRPAEGRQLLGRAGSQGNDDVSCYRINDEIDEVEWVPWKDAPQRLTYAYDRETLAEARPLRRSTRALVVLRHGQARSRGRGRATTGGGRSSGSGRPRPSAWCRCWRRST